MLNKKHPGYKKVQGQSEAALQIRTLVCATKTLYAEAKKLHTYQKSFNYLKTYFSL